MRHSKMLGPLAVVAATLMAFAGSASATTLTSPTGTTLGSGTLIKTEVEGSHMRMHGTVTLTCQQSSLEGKITNAHGANGVEAMVEKAAFTSCGNNTVTVQDGGTLTINSKSEVFSTGTEVTMLTHNLLGTWHCIYKTNNTRFGTLTSSHTTGGNAIIDLGSPAIPMAPTDGSCKNDAVWTGNYKVTTPGTLYVD